MSARAPSTVRLYAAAQEQFRDWCEWRKVKFPPADHSVLADYFRECGRRRGVHAARLHMAAIGRLYRAEGVPFDVHAPAIQRVLAPIRARIRNSR